MILTRGIVVVRKGKWRMKKDLRFTLPLWQIGGILLTIILTILIGISTEVVRSDSGRAEFELELSTAVGSILIGTIIVLFIYMGFFLWAIYQHNRQYPEKRMNVFSFKPKSSGERDQVFDEITKRATKKVYAYYAWVLPIFVAVALVTFWSRTMILIGILVVALGQYWIYYASIQDHLRKMELKEKT